MPELGVAVVVLREATVLLTKREDFENWCLPGGAVDDGESVLDFCKVRRGLPGVVG
jgi:ADP-ribose pyrophosphatase YjhB (NUDIX family)